MEHGCYCRLCGVVQSKALRGDNLPLKGTHWILESLLCGAGEP